jgi:hypothetical protein
MGCESEKEEMPLNNSMRSESTKTITFVDPKPENQKPEGPVREADEEDETRTIKVLICAKDDKTAEAKAVKSTEENNSGWTSDWKPSK